jgi:MoaA/NifB/PqqE/SkfB family radical SAM enzyme
MKKIKVEIISDRRKKWIRLWLVFFLFLRAYKYFNKIKTAAEMLKKMSQNRKTIYGNDKINRFVRVGSKYYYSSDVPGWPSKAYAAYIDEELKRLSNHSIDNRKLQTIIFSITNRCHLQCKHCYESQNINHTDTLSLDELKFILKNIEDKALFHIQLSGGEPLARFDDLIALMQSAREGTEFWLLTSGFGLNIEKAKMLKKAGLTGAHISLDHWDETLHNEFRGNSQSYHWVKQAVNSCLNEGILTSLSLCATKEFVNDYNLNRYVELAKLWRVNFIRILEPRKVGRFMDLDIELSKSQLNILDKFYLTLINDNNYSNYPILDYPGYYQRRTGCFGSGDRYLYIDSEGIYHACPFCQKDYGSALTVPIDSAIIKMAERGCHKYEMSTI